MRAPDIKIIAETAEFVVIDKPAGLDSQNSRDDRPSVVQWLSRRYGFQGLVHRLDFGTSGAMICARTPVAAKLLTRQLQDGTMERTYLALAMGRGLPAEGIFATPLEDQEAVTHYKVIETFANACLVQLRLQTGRKHQIRRHLFEAGFPLIGDHLYKKKGSDRLMKRPALHSAELTLAGKVFRASLPADMQALIQTLRKSQADFNG